MLIDKDKPFYFVILTMLDYIVIICIQHNFFPPTLRDPFLGCDNTLI